MKQLLKNIIAIVLLATLAGRSQLADTNKGGDGTELKKNAELQNTAGPHGWLSTGTLKTHSVKLNQGEPKSLGQL